ALQSLFPNAQIFASTHSPWVAASLKDAWVHVFRIDPHTGRAELKESVPSKAGYSTSYVQENLFGLPEFDFATEIELTNFRMAVEKVRNRKSSLKSLLLLAEVLAAKSQELSTMVGFELNQLEHSTRRR